MSEAAFPKLDGIVVRATPSTLRERAMPYLTGCWLRAYWQSNRESDVVETTLEHCSYLFDIASERLIAAWATSHGKHHGARDGNRMRSHPHDYGPDYHRGHCIPHSLGGPTDINLVPQLGKINIGPFRELEKAAVAAPGSLYFTNWLYGDSSQLPRAVIQGLLIAGRSPSIQVHPNR